MLVGTSLMMVGWWPAGIVLEILRAMLLETARDIDKQVLGIKSVYAKEFS